MLLSEKTPTALELYEDSLQSAEVALSEFDANTD